MKSRRRSHRRLVGVVVSVGVLFAGAFMSAASAGAAGRYGYVAPSAVLRVAGPGTTSASQGVAVSASADGNTVAVGAPTNVDAPYGRVYVWNHGPHGWTLVAALQEPGATGHGFFGSAVALSADGRHLVVGDYGRRINRQDEAGAVYVFSAQGSSWAFDAQLLEPHPAYLDGFGLAVAMNSDGSELIAQSLIDSVATTSGGAHIFTKAGNGTWSQSAVLTGGADHDLQGRVSLSGDGTVAIVGAYRFQPNEDQGTDALIFERDSSGAWARTSVLAQSGTYGTGNVVALSTDGTTAVVGNPDLDRTASVTVFHRAVQNWPVEATFIAHNSAAKGDFGSGVAISSDGSTVVAGAPYRSARGVTNRGGVYTFHRGTSGWAYLGATYIAGSRANENDGRSVAVSGDGQEVVIGAPGYSTNGDFHTLTGAAFIVGG